MQTNLLYVMNKKIINVGNSAKRQMILEELCGRSRDKTFIMKYLGVLAVLFLASAFWNTGIQFNFLLRTSASDA